MAYKDKYQSSDSQVDKRDFIISAVVGILHQVTDLVVMVTALRGILCPPGPWSHCSGPRREW